MKKILLMVDKLGPSIKIMEDYLTSHLEDAQVEAKVFTDLTFDVNGKDIKVFIDDVDIRQYSLVYFRRADHSLFSLAGTLAICLDYLKIPYFDTRLRNIGGDGDKFTSLVKLSVEGLPTIPTFFCTKEKIEKYIDHIIKRFGFPVIAKELSTQHGRGVFKLQSREDFKALLKIEKEGKKTQFLFQKMIPLEDEYRLLVMGDKVVVLQKMKRDLSEFELKIDWEAEEQFLPVDRVPIQMKEIAVRAAKKLDLQIAGADAFFEKVTGKIWLLEVNRGPGFTFDTKLSPELSELAKFFSEELKRT